MASTNFISIESNDAYTAQTPKFQQDAKPAVLYFYADWAAPCTHMTEVVQHLSVRYPTVTFLKINAEKADKAAEQFSVETVPTFVFFNGGHQTGTVTGADAAEVTKRVQGFGQTPAAAPLALHTRLQALMNKAPIVLFMKGSPAAPKCKFSRAILDLLSQQKIDFDYFDILEDEEVRQGLKELSNWPTYPQLYANGKLVGGLDVVKDLIEEEQLHEALGLTHTQTDAQDDLPTRLTKLINQKPVMLFMKGTPETPRCGFSMKAIALLKSIGVDFGSFDILEDEEVRQGLKEFSKWPTYPQLYHKGQLVGGLDIMNEMHEGDELEELLKS
eukprot:TRINITY_DN4449_c0_g1::TRINITY_DN4449_c0_g1_i1::g.7341::m.7341 TRINITY_DN4449_c0_g1::TRINITY_DN4449_c0_g1_i1::g.7341  ORF type:complete len:339 (+),score=68.71,sp/Q28ID3/GLRX3_XENTR/50.00/3e-103,Glutaredoxin/PF00462.19/39,Glutaredoxin/PF00462.19/4.6e-18,Glutaredoxin/PF00462.19/2.4e-17,Thioredoxin/PF00085.15/8.6e-17,SH3BGR/PF04908.10/0.0024,SH3BGR/PF04908.10/0.037,GST_N_3/PF13417.1/1.5e+03,GST_N_3/PF13417.1/2.8,GST_N_3/PF13417.1/0.24,Phosducin/PF02114.11/0.00011,Thioredoxin_8/PF13905.1/0.0011,Thio